MARTQPTSAHRSAFGTCWVFMTPPNRCGLEAEYAQELARRRGAALVVHDLGGTPGGDSVDPEPASATANAITAAGGRARLHR